MNVLFKIAGITIGIKNSELSEIMDSYEKRVLKPFMVKTGDSYNSFMVSLKKVDEIKKKKIYKSEMSPFLKNAPQRFFRENWSYVLNDRNIKNVSESDYTMNPYCFLALNKKTRHCCIFLKKHRMALGKKINPAYMPGLIILKLLFRIIFNSEKSGILLHASSLEYNGSGYVFIAPSGYGKSTVIKILKPGRSLSDETAIIRKNAEGYMAFPSPWWNKHTINMPSITDPDKGADLKAIFFILQSKKTKIIRVGYKQALAELTYRDQPFQQIRFFDTKYGIKSFYLFSQKMINDIPAFELSIKKHRNFGCEFEKIISHYRIG